MKRVEVRDTVREVNVIEKLDFELDITSRQYRSEYDVDGEVRVLADATHDVVENRRHPPRGAFDLLTPLVDGNESFDRFPSTRLFVGLKHRPPTEQDDESFQEDVVTAATDVSGVPENGTVEFDVDWTAEEAEAARSNEETAVLSEPYDVEGLSSDQLPIVVRANLYRDAKEITSGDDDVGLRQRLEGLSALQIEIEHRSPEDRGVLRIPRFEVQLSSTFPQVEFSPQQNATYDPESRRVRWTNQQVDAGETGRFLVLGPIRELLDIETVQASLRGEVVGRTLSGMRLAGVYDESGEPFPATDLDAGEKVTVTSEIEIDPSALSGQAQEVTRSTIRSKTPPEALYEELVSLCRREGIQVQSQSAPGEAEPVAGRDGVFAITEDGEPGALGVKKEFGDRGVVHAEITVTGQFTPISETNQVSAFDEADDQLVRADEGAMDTRGESTAEVVARSTDSELNTELIGMLETVFGGES